MIGIRAFKNIAEKKDRFENVSKWSKFSDTFQHVCNRKLKIIGKN